MAKTQQKPANYGQKMRPDTVSDVFGKKVYSINGVYLGTVDNVRIDIQKNNVNGLCLTDVNSDMIKATGDDKENVIIPYGWVNSISDVVMTIDVIERLEK